MLEVRDLCVHYGQHLVVDHLNLTLQEGEVLMLVGPTGCGKTTILHALAGLVPISDGQITLGPWQIDRHHPVPPEKRQVGMVFQDFALFPHLSVEQNIGFRLRDTAPVEHWLDMLGLAPYRHVRPGRLSGGQKQRVALARALAHQPNLMLLDEPLSSLDAALRDNLLWEIRSALKAAGMPAIWVTHDQSEALSAGDRLGILNGGKLEQLDTPEACYARPASRFVAEFLGDATFLPAQLRDGVADTRLGHVPAAGNDVSSGPVDVLVRPDDLAVTLAPGSDNARVEWCRYEGESRLYAVQLDNGPVLRARVSHEFIAAPGERVQVSLSTTHPLAAFAVS